MNKKVLSLVLAFAIVLGSFGSVAFATEAKTTETTPVSRIEQLESMTQRAKVQALVDRKLVLGRTTDAGTTDLALTANIQRAEVTKFVVEAIGQKSLADTLHGLVAPFVDVPATYWANGLISAASTAQVNANAIPIVIGNEKGEFMPEKDVTYAELATMLVRIVVKDLNEKDMKWPNDYITVAKQRGIFAGIKTNEGFDAMAPANRADAFEMIYNALAIMENKQVYDFGAKVGVVSKLTQNEIQFNQDAKQTYKLTPATVISRGTTWATLGRNYEYATVGSLVRYIVNANGEVTHIIELGNQRDGAFSKARFNGLFANDSKGYVFETALYGTANDDTSVKRATSAKLFNNAGYVDLQLRNNSRDFTFTKNDDKTANIDHIRINGSTRVFAIDRQNNEVKEFNNVSEIVNYLDVNNEKPVQVYGAFEEVQNRFEAKYLVFERNYAAEPVVRRAKTALNNSYFFDAEDTTGKVETLDVRNTPIFPDRKSVVAYDVLDVRQNMYFALDEALSYKIIDAANDNVYKVETYKNEKLELVDKDGLYQEYPVHRDVREFLAGQIAKGDNVQIAMKDGKVWVISEVPFALKGNLKDGYRIQKDGWIEEAKYDSVTKTISLTISDRVRDNDPLTATNVRNVRLTPAATQAFMDRYNMNDLDINTTNLQGYKVEFDINSYDSNREAVIMNVVIVNYGDVTVPFLEYKLRRDFQNATAPAVKGLNETAYGKELVSDYVEFSYNPTTHKASARIKKGGFADAQPLVNVARPALQELVRAGLVELEIGGTILNPVTATDQQLATAIYRALPGRGQQKDVVVNYTLRNGLTETKDKVVIKATNALVDAE